MNRAILAISVFVGIAAIMIGAIVAPVYAGGGFTVSVDIKPRSINPDSHGIIPVVVFGEPSVDLGDVIAISMEFGTSQATIIHPNGHLADLNGDGFTDFLGHYRTQDTGIQAGETEACIFGNLNDGTPIGGCDAIITKPG